MPQGCGEHWYCAIPLSRHLFRIQGGSGVRGAERGAMKSEKHASMVIKGASLVFWPWRSWI